jgi:hypothetical protein
MKQIMVSPGGSKRNMASLPPRLQVEVFGGVAREPLERTDASVALMA